MYYFIGIKGAGMSALAVILKQLGNTVVGSDLDKHFFTEEELVKNNIPMYVYNKDNISNLDKNYTIIKGASIKEDHEELVEAKKLGFKILEYNEMLGIMTSDFKTICVAGCHGKTTTTNMLALALKNQGVNYLIGDGSGSALSDNRYFALEACEYQRHFLAYHPYYAIITNIDLDHVDYYKNMDDIIDAFTEYSNNASYMVIANGDDDNVRKIKFKKDVVYYGLGDNNDVRATNIIYNTDGISFDINCYGHFDLPIYGEGQLMDAIAVITLCYLERIDYKEVYNNLKEFVGAKRRFTEKVVGNNIIIDDYAHHPKEVDTTISAIKQKYPDKKIVIIFQPHTYSRTKEFANDLVNVFNKVDATYLLDIHPAREKQDDYPGITSDIIINKLDKGYHINIDEASKLSKYDNTVFAFMSPNDINKLESDLIELLKK
ncbi:MAG: UDP-N-acetylmuramate--L-alanine ligase [Bacilli bacterium]|nr:UDP-N-acetylmuramate--L-alanine ligase [Bacilli bacterium]